MDKRMVKDIKRQETVRRVVFSAFLISLFSFLISPVSAQPKKSRVKQHLNEVYEKLGASNRAEAVAIAMRRQLLKF